MNQFWRDLKSFNKRKPKLPTRIDHAATVPDICHMWKDKFAGVLNSLDDGGYSRAVDNPSGNQAYC